MSANAAQMAAPAQVHGNRSLRVAAVQMPSRIGAVAENLARANGLADEAAAQGAELILFPELMPSGYAWDRRAWSGAEPSRGPTSEWLRATGKRLSVWIGTSFLEADGEDFWNTFVLAGPHGGEAGRIRKEFPALDESRIFRGAPGSHVIDTPVGRMGIGICFDAHTAAVARRFAVEGVDLVLAPHCYCIPARPSRLANLADLERLRRNVAALAPLYARILGVPAVVTNRVGPWDAARSSPYVFVGQATIADSDGTVVAHRGDDEGIAIGDVNLDPKRRTRTPPRAYSRWIYPGPPGREVLRMIEWWGARAYRSDRERRRQAVAIGGSPEPHADTGDRQ
jgi:N-carbamoylputrescine amidase